ncbi:hypothetical protein [Novosphingobium resinovorum]|uniref:Phage-related protein n=1 Tax=Novosphingobium resinovorum TaxID=158500 RepID=A0A1D8A523_9SPHN|nr:hypothetical protein [Novosphingobium resinovorum]AOR77186.1 hypothetical protein BES08_10825 [Novosphingobium resinovorum]
MTTKGIIFSAPMVRALLDGRKTQTRRLIKLPPAPEHLGEWQASTVGGPGILDRHGNETPEYPCVWHTRTGATIVPPYAVGDRLYVREAFRGPYAYEAHGYKLKDWGNKPCWYTADGEPAGRGAAFYWPKGRPSIHMPRWASRLWLEVTAVRVQRLQDISEDDAEAEGAERLVFDGEAFYAGSPEGTYRCGFAGIWSHLHTAEGEHWDDNPWIVAVTFDVHRGNIDQVQA